MKEVVNPVTGVTEIQFTATLLSVSQNALERTNGNGETKKFRVASIRFTDAEGEVQETSAVINEANYAYGMETGKDYLATARPDTGANAEPGSVIISVSHLTQVSAPRATANMFGKVFVNQVAEVGA